MFLVKILRPFSAVSSILGSPFKSWTERFKNCWEVSVANTGAPESERAYSQARKAKLTISKQITRNFKKKNLWNEETRKVTEK